MSNKLIIGMMSGTSADGIDAALVRFDSVSSLEVIATAFTPFSNALRAQINETALSKVIENCEESDLHESLAHDYATAAKNLAHKAGIDLADVNAIANHGQTVRHEPNANPGYSLQLGNPQTIADLCGTLTIGQFRQADLKAGGQGAPLMPAFHSTVFGGEDRYLLNIGGIANITHLGETVIGFDSGPGNTLLDQWIYKIKGKAYDKNGEWAASGTVIPALLERLIADPYFGAGFPKSTGPDFFNLAWLGDVQSYQPQDVQATLLSLTVLSIAGEIKQLGNLPGEIYVCGGGAHNTLMMNNLKDALPSHVIHTTDSLGIPADWVEAVGFAWLGYCRLNSIDSNLPSVTGARASVVLGEVSFPTEN